MDGCPQIYLVRHGETEWSASGRHTGRTDLGLTAKGRADAVRLGRFLAAIKFRRVLVSPLQRAVDTAVKAGFQDQIEINPNLREWDYGDLEGLTFQEIRQATPGWTIWTHSCPHGETAHDVGVRADSVLESVGADDSPVLLFAHGHVLRVLAARWLGLPATEAKMFALTTASVSRLGSEHEARVIQWWNLPCGA